jgi:hypothetical protein
MCYNISETFPKKKRHIEGRKGGGGVGEKGKERQAGMKEGTSY